jgi:hypothetical protein
MFRRAREARGLSIEEVSNDSKIPRRHLEALERDDLPALPAGFYQRATVRMYARAIKLDQSLAVARLERASQAPTGRAARSTGDMPDRSLTRPRLLMLGAVLVAGVVLMRAIGGREALPVRAADAPAAGVAGDPDRSSARPDPAAPGQPVGPPASAATDESAATPAVVTPRDPPPPPAPVASVPPPAGEPAAVAPSDPPTAPAEPSPVPQPAGPLNALVLITEPPGARVTVNGIGWGVSPVTIRYLPAGEKRIRVSREGYVADERVVRITEGRPTRIEIQLQRVP